MIEQVIPSWQTLEDSAKQAQSLIFPNGFDFLPRINDSYQTIRRYAPAMLEILPLQATSSSNNLMQAVELLRDMNRKGVRKLSDNPKSIPTKFIKQRWDKLIYTDNGMDARYYELCVLSELNNALRSGDIWVQGSRQFKAFDDYLLPNDTFQNLWQVQALPISIETDCKVYLDERFGLLEAQFKLTHQLAKANQLPDVSITPTSELKITPLEAVMPKSAEI